MLSFYFSLFLYDFFFTYEKQFFCSSFFFSLTKCNAKNPQVWMKIKANIFINSVKNRWIGLKFTKKREKRLYIFSWFISFVGSIIMLWFCFFCAYSLNNEEFSIALSMILIGFRILKMNLTRFYYVHILVIEFTISIVFFSIGLDKMSTK